MKILKWIICYFFDICPHCEQSDIRFEPTDHALTCRGKNYDPSPENEADRNTA